MKRISITLLLLFVACFGITLWAQQAKKTIAKKPEAQTKAAGKILSVPVYLGHSDLIGGPVPKKVFDSLLKEGLYAKDSGGNAYQINGFDFTYGELNLYEDSVGNLVNITDYNVEFCPGNRVDTVIASTIYQRTKNGDTIYFDHIQLQKADNTMALGKTMKFEITK